LARAALLSRSQLKGPPAYFLDRPHTTFPKTGSHLLAAVAVSTPGVDFGNLPKKVGSKFNIDEATPTSVCSILDRRKETFINAAEHFGIKFPNSLVAFACALLDEIYAEDVNLTATVCDQAFSLQLSRYLADAGTPHAHHLGKKLLGQWQLGPDEIVHSHKPLADALFDAVQRVASGCLLYLGEKKLIILGEKSQQCGRGLRDALEISCVNDASPARHLHHNLVQRKPIVKRLGRTKHTILPDHTGFDRPAVLQFDYAGKYAFLREVDLIHCLATLGDYATLLQLNDPEMGSKLFKIDMACSCENTIL